MLPLAFAVALQTYGQRQDDMKQTVEYLASQKLGGRFPGTAGDTLASEYIVRYLRGLKLKPVVKDKKKSAFYHDFTFGKDVKRTTHNIFAVLPGNDKNLKNEFIVHNIGDETLLVPTAEANFHGLVQGNKTVGVILECLKHDTTEQEIVDTLCERFEGDPRHGKEIPPDLMPVKREGRWIMPTDRIVEEMVSCALQLRGAAGEGGQGAPASSADPVSRAAAVSSVEEAAYRFHRMLADTVIGCVMQIADETGVRAAALSGGCFQNRLLLEMIEEGLTDRGIVVYRHRMVPPNDGGIALGQAVAAAAILRAEAADNASDNAADNAAGK